MTDRTTIRLPPALLRQARKKAADEDRTLTSLIEEGLRLVLAKQSKARKRRIVLPASRATGGTLPGVDIDDNSSLIEAMEQRLPVDKLR